MNLKHKNNSHYQLAQNGEFIITDYNKTKLFSSFFPGIAGKDGIPMWVFYVNRGQCLCSMGIQDKQHPIMEFLPANWAYNLVSRQGFRTFLKITHHPSINYYEPFQNHLQDSAQDRTQRMVISPSGLTLEEENNTLGLRFRVEYFTVPQDNYAGLIRTLHIQNMNSESVELEGLDGLPLIIPYGVDNLFLKNMRRLIEAFVEVVNFNKGAPFFKGKVEPADRPDVLQIQKGNFYLGFEVVGSKTKLVEPIVDPENIFGTQSDYSYPEKFLTASKAEIIDRQILENRLPCAMGIFQSSIPPGETYTYTSIIGHAASVDALNALVPVITQQRYIRKKAETNEEIIKLLTQKNLICSRESTLDYYMRQNFLDNTLRGGFPYTLQGNINRTTLHLFSRKHGDLERDYNDFRLTPTHYSQGNGNFRDINQNRRSDLFFNPDVQEENVEHFYNLIQLDGYNPLVIKEIHFVAKNSEALESVLAKYFASEYIKPVKAFLKDPFTPGEFLAFLNEHVIKYKYDSEKLLGDILGICNKIHSTDYGEGFWTDHWTYNLDLLENYLAFYPEKYRYLFFEKKSFSFYDNPHRVLPRDDKYVIWDGKAMQLDAVIFDEEKNHLIKDRSANPNLVRTKFGKGTIYYTSLINKILCLIVNKISTLDPAGVGVEMEAGKPNWYDALNGLPGLFGSSISETLEIKRNILFLLETFQEYKVENEKWKIYEELNEFMLTVGNLLNKRLSSFEFWEEATSARELYREKTRFGISGNEKTINIKEVKSFLKSALTKLDEGIEKAWDKENSIPFTYFINKPIDYRMIELGRAKGKRLSKRSSKGLPCFKALKFEQTPLPHFLEGPVHYLRCHPNPKTARELVQSIRKSGLYDKKLKMYKVNASLADQPMEIGRTRVFSPGWFENESVWMHMEYKYLLELLRNNFYSEFFQDFKNVCVPFFDPEIYGRSILENSSFIVSSANPDPSIHGNGFVARLSGATAEFIHMLLLMMVGPKPFRINPEGKLQLQFAPSLPEWLFNRKAKKLQLFFDNQWQEIEVPANTFSFMFLGEILVTYHNPDLKDTFGVAAVKPSQWTVVDLAGQAEIYSNDKITGKIALKIRERKVKRIEIELK